MSYVSTITYVVGTQKYHLSEMVLLGTTTDVQIDGENINLFTIYFILNGRYRKHNLTFSLVVSRSILLFSVFAGYSIGCKFAPQARRNRGGGHGGGPCPPNNLQLALNYILIET